MRFGEGVRRVLKYQGSEPHSFRIIRNSGILGEYEDTNDKVLKPEKAKRYIDDEALLEKVKSQEIKARVDQVFEKGILRKDYTVLWTRISKAPEKKMRAFLHGSTSHFKKVRELDEPDFLDLMKISKCGDKSKVLIRFEKEDKDQLSKLEKVVNTLKEIDQHAEEENLKYIT